MPLFTLAFAAALWRSLSAERDLVPFVYAMGHFMMNYLGLGISAWPTAVPYQLTLHQVSASTSSYAFLGLGVMFFIPVILTYTGWSY